MEIILSGILFHCSHLDRLVVMCTSVRLQRRVNPPCNLREVSKQIYLYPWRKSHRLLLPSFFPSIVRTCLDARNQIHANQDWKSPLAFEVGSISVRMLRPSLIEQQLTCSTLPSRSLRHSASPHRSANIFGLPGARNVVILLAERGWYDAMLTFKGGVLIDTSRRNRLYSAFKV